MNAAGFQETEVDSRMRAGNPYVCAILCVLGVAMTGYGMERRNHAVFILGLLCVICSYLLIRKHLKRGAGSRNDGE